MQTKIVQSDAFRTFPDFSPLTLGDRGRYEAAINQYPPISDLSFACMMMWWNHLDSAAVSELNGNLVISYWFPGMERYSGLSLVGTNKIDESACTIFDYLREKGDPVRLVHVPEFVIAAMEYPEQFTFKEERRFDEYIVPIDAHYPMNHLSLFRRRRVRGFLEKVGKEAITVRSIDLDDSDNQRMLLEKTLEWGKKGAPNAVYELEVDAIKYGINYATLIGLDNVCLFVNNELQGFCLYQLTHDKRYVTIHHARAGRELPRTTDYMIYAVAEWFSERDITYANLEMDLGLPLTRVLKLGLGPANFFRKYTTTPANELN